MKETTLHQIVTFFREQYAAASVQRVGTFVDFEKWLSELDSAMEGSVQLFALVSLRLQGAMAHLTTYMRLQYQLWLRARLHVV